MLTTVTAFNRFSEKILICAIIVSSLFLAGCADNRADGSSNKDTGSIAFSINWPESVAREDADRAPNRAINCSSAGVSNVILTVADGNRNELVSSTFTCTAHYGRIDDVPAGSNRIVICTA